MHCLYRTVDLEKTQPAYPVRILACESVFETNQNGLAQQRSIILSTFACFPHMAHVRLHLHLPLMPYLRNLAVISGELDNIHMWVCESTLQCVDLANQMRIDQ